MIIVRRALPRSRAIINFRSSSFQSMVLTLLTSGTAASPLVALLPLSSVYYDTLIPRGVRFMLGYVRSSTFSREKNFGCCTTHSLTYFPSFYLSNHFFVVVFRATYVNFPPSFLPDTPNVWISFHFDIVHDARIVDHFFSSETPNVSNEFISLLPFGLYCCTLVFIFSSLRFWFHLTY